MNAKGTGIHTAFAPSWLAPATVRTSGPSISLISSTIAGFSSSGCFSTNFPTTSAAFAARDRGGDVPDIPDDDDPARDPPVQVEEVVVVAGAPLPENGAEQELPPHLQGVVVGIVPLLEVGVAVLVGVEEIQIGSVPVAKTC